MSSPIRYPVPLEAYPNRAAAFEAADDVPLSPDGAATLGEVIETRYSRRAVIQGALGVAAIAALWENGLAMAQASAANPPVAFGFDEIVAGIDERHHVAGGHRADILIRWGDPVFADAPPFDPRNQSAESQLRQFGYNCDYVGFVPLDAEGTRGLLCVNHEYTSEEMMFPGLGRQDRSGFKGMTRELAMVEMAAHGGTIIEIERRDGRWATVPAGRYNRRISTLETEMSIDGPAAGSSRMRTGRDPSGTRVTGTLNNCAGGITPWGTYLMAEENFHGYFWTDTLENGKPAKDLGGPEARSWKRYGMPGMWYDWGRYDERFNLDKEPNEANRFGWIVEVDPLDPASMPVKHTALGRFRHEGAESIVAPDGRVVVYSGDDARFDYVYRFVSRERYREGDRAHNMRLLTEGTLSVARFDAQGRVHWLPLVHGTGPLTPENGFADQADVVIDARLAADALGATRMDRPEDVEPTADGRVYVMLTNNADRKPDETDPANPRPANAFGHVIEMRAPGGDHTADVFDWEVLVRCGDPAIADVGAEWHPATSANGWFASPDNCAFDAAGRLWISTDQGSNWKATGHADGLYALGTVGEERGRSRLFFRAPVGAEVCGPCFTPDGTSLFLAVQHPGVDGTKDFPGFGRNATFDDPVTRWPDFDPSLPPRPSVVVVTREDGGPVGG
ncbi:MAG: DUF839 domain-containing protein [Rhizobiales bacterium]|nr:DUF839 domain-containing protein [Hyphomicrobiales bacterium]